MSFSQYVLTYGFSESHDRAVLTDPVVKYLCLVFPLSLKSP